MDNQTRKNLTIVRWTTSTFWGWLLGIVLIVGLSSLLDSMGIEDMQFYVGLGMGAGVGYAQWLLLRKHIPMSKNWIWFSAAGMGIPFIILDLLLTKSFTYKMPLGVVLGAILVGFLQFRLLKRHSEKANLWIWSSIAGWTLGVLAVLTIDYTKQLPPYLSSNLLLALINLLLILLGGIILGVITGIALKKIVKEEAPVA